MQLHGQNGQVSIDLEDGTIYQAGKRVSLPEGTLVDLKGLLISLPTFDVEENDCAIGRVRVEYDNKGAVWLVEAEGGVIRLALAELKRYVYGNQTKDGLIDADLVE